MGGRTHCCSALLQLAPDRAAPPSSPVLPPLPPSTPFYHCPAGISHLLVQQALLSGQPLQPAVVVALLPHLSQLLQQMQANGAPAAQVLQLQQRLVALTVETAKQQGIALPANALAALGGAGAPAANGGGGRGGVLGMDLSAPRQAVAAAQPSAAGNGPFKRKATGLMMSLNQPPAKAMRPRSDDGVAGGGMPLPAAMSGRTPMQQQQQPLAALAAQMLQQQAGGGAPLAALQAGEPSAVAAALLRAAHGGTSSTALAAQMAHFLRGRGVSNEAQVSSGLAPAPWLLSF